LIKQLKAQGAIIEKKFSGIYYVTNNTIFDTQIIVTGQLSEETHSCLRVLTRDLQEKDVRNFLTSAEKFKLQGDRNNVDSILQVSVKANRQIYEIVREDLKMCEALRELMKDEFDEERNKAETASRLEDIRSIMENCKFDVEQAMDALNIPQQKRALYLSKL
jgi:NACalpha-BTF3-like transcription factor